MIHAQQNRITVRFSVTSERPAEQTSEEIRERFTAYLTTNDCEHSVEVSLEMVARIERPVGSGKLRQIVSLLHSDVQNAA